MRALIRLVVFKRHFINTGYTCKCHAGYNVVSSADKVALNTTTLINALITMFAECIYLPCV
jgi:hypothetical protein